MEKAAGIRTCRVLFRLIGNAGPRKPSVSGEKTKYEGPFVHFHGSRLECLAEHFRKQFMWPTATAENPVKTASKPIQVDIGYPLEGSGGFLVKHKTDGPDVPSLSFSKEGDVVLISELP